VIRERLKRALLAGLHARALRRPAGALARDAVFVCPHPDDETLGCGGTIVQKRRAGARCTIVYLTDGAKNGTFPPAELAARRKAEALAAAAVLGVAAGAVLFLDYPDGALARHEPDAVRRVAEMLATVPFDEAYVPYARDPHADHAAAARIALAALRRIGRPAETFEYPVWLWYRWPFVPMRRTTPGGRVLDVALGALAAWRLRGFGAAVDVRDALDVKRAALDQHVSQMRAGKAGDAARLLWQAGDGEWLALFFHELELYRRSRAC